MKNRLIPLALALLLVGLLSLVFRDFVREAIVTPVAYAVWIVGLLIESLPQAILWTFFLAIVLFMAIGSLITRPKPAGKAGSVGADRRGQVEVLARRIDLAAGGYYFRWHLARRLRDLAVDAIAYRQRLTHEQVQQQLEAGTLDMPPAIRAYFQAELTLGPVSRMSDLRHRLRPRTPAAPLDLDPEEVVRYLERTLVLEAQVEVQGDSHDR